MNKENSQNREKSKRKLTIIRKRKERDGTISITR